MELTGTCYSWNNGAPKRWSIKSIPLLYGSSKESCYFLDSSTAAQHCKTTDTFNSNITQQMWYKIKSQNYRKCLILGKSSYKNSTKQINNPSKVCYSTHRALKKQHKDTLALPELWSVTMYSLCSSNTTWILSCCPQWFSIETHCDL